MPSSLKLQRLFAFDVSRRVAPAGGGLVTPSEQARAALEEAYTAARLDTGLPVSLVLDTATRTSPVHDALLSIAYGQPREAATSANLMATRLAGSLAPRSKPCLLVISVTESGRGSSSRVVVWIFPRDAAFRLRRGSIQFLNDIFSLSSNLRKAASFSGPNTRTGFLTGRVLDYEANAVDRFVADFWIRSFLRRAAPDPDGRRNTNIRDDATPGERQAQG